MHWRKDRRKWKMGKIQKRKIQSTKHKIQKREIQSEVRYFCIGGKISRNGK